MRGSYESIEVSMSCFCEYRACFGRTSTLSVCSQISFKINFDAALT